MKGRLLAGTVSVLLLTSAASALAGEAQDRVLDEQLVVALETEHFEIPETDISHLAVGEKETIVTEFGRTVDIVRTEDGVDVYLDGELLDIDMHGEEHVIHEEIEILCEHDVDCDELSWVSEDGEIDFEAVAADGAHKVITIRKETEIVAGDTDVAVENDDVHVGHDKKVIIVRRKTQDDS